MRIAVVFLLLFSSSLFAQTLQPLTVILDWFPNPDHAPLFVAQEQGFFKQQGLNVKLIGPANPADPPKLVAAGKANLAVTYQSQLLVDVQQGLPLVRIATLIKTPLDCLVVDAHGPIKNIADLKGKTIGYSGSDQDLAVLKTMLQQSNISLSQVKLINISYDLTQALLTHRVDAVIGLMRNFEVYQLQQEGFVPRVFYPEQFGVPPHDELIIVANRNELHDPRLPKFLAALQEGVSYLHAHPKQSWQLFAKAHPELNNTLNQKAWFETLDDFANNPGKLHKNKYNRFEQFMAQNKLLKKPLPLNSYAAEILPVLSKPTNSASE